MEAILQSKIKSVSDKTNDGFSVAISGNGLVAANGSPYSNSNAGNVVIKQKIDGLWQSTQTITYGDIPYAVTTAQNITSSALFGYDIALNYDGSILLIGAPQTNNNSISNYGITYCFKKEESGWMYDSCIIRGSSSYLYNGYSVAINGQGTLAAIVNGYGTVSVNYLQYNSSSKSWSSIYIYSTSYSNSTTGSFDLRRARVRMNLAGDTLILGTPLDSNGTVKVLQLSNNTLVLKGSGFTGAASSDYYGAGVDINEAGDIIVIGAYYYDSTSHTNNGAVFVYKYNGSSWASYGQTLYGANNYDIYGRAVAIDSTGNYIAVSSMFSDILAQDSGHVNIYYYDNTSLLWKNYTKPILGTITSGYYGCDIDMSYSNSGIFGIIIGSSSMDSQSGWRGQSDIYEISTDTENYKILDTTQAQAPYVNTTVSSRKYNGHKVAMSGNGLVAISADPFAFSVTGSIVVYRYSSGSWAEEKNIVAADFVNITKNGVTCSSSVRTGMSVAINYDGTVIAIASPNSTVNSTSNNGCTFVFSYSSSTWSLTSILKSGTYTNTSSYGVSINAAGTRISMVTGNTPVGRTIWDYNSGSGTWSETNLGSVTANSSFDDSYPYAATSMSDDGNTVVFGIGYATGDSEIVKGQAYVYYYNGSSWSQLGQTLNGERAYDRLGSVTRINNDGTLIAFGLYYDIGTLPVSGSSEGSNEGAVEVYQYNSGNARWTLLGPRLVGVSGSLFGRSVGLKTLNTDHILAVGMPLKSLSSSNAGGVQLYKYSQSENNWDLYMDEIAGTINMSYFGQSVALDNNITRLICGASDIASNSGNIGYIKIYPLANFTVNQKTILLNSISGQQIQNSNAMSSNIDGSVIVAGNEYYNSGVGIVSIYSAISSIRWELLQTLQPFYDLDNHAKLNSDSSETTILYNTSMTKFGRSVDLSLDGTTLAIGMVKCNYNSISEPGAVFVYKSNGTGSKFVHKYTLLRTNTADFWKGIETRISGDGNYICVVNGTSSTSTVSAQLYKYNSSTDNWTSVVRFATSAAAGNVDDTNTRLAINEDGSVFCIGDWSYSTLTGRVIIYRSTNGWSTNSSSTITGSTTLLAFGYSLALSGTGNRLAVSSILKNSSLGNVAIYDYSSSSWSLTRQYDGQLTSESFGTCLSITQAGDKMIVGATGNNANGTNAGICKVYDLTASTNDTYVDPIFGDAAGSYLGEYVKILDGGRIICGAFNTYYTSSQYVYCSVYYLTNQNSILYPQKAILATQLIPIPSEITSSNFDVRCIDISDDGKVLAVGNEKWFAGSGSTIGNVAIYLLLSGQWVMDTEINRTSPSTGITFYTSLSAYYFGRTVKLNYDGTRLLVGDFLLSLSTDSNPRGYVFLYTKVAGIWTFSSAIANPNLSYKYFGARIDANSSFTKFIIRNNYDTVHAYIYNSSLNLEYTITDIAETPSDYNDTGNVCINSSGTIVATSLRDYGTNKGHVMIYENLTPTWTLTANIIGVANQYLGRFIAMNDDGTVIAMSNFDDNQTGGIIVYNKVDGFWIPKGNSIVGITMLDGFGYSLKLNDRGDLLFASAYTDNSTYANSGSIVGYKYYDSSKTWEIYFKKIMGAGGSNLGRSITINKKGTLLFASSSSGVQTYTLNGPQRGYNIACNSTNTIRIVSIPFQNNIGSVEIYDDSQNQLDAVITLQGTQLMQRYGMTIGMDSSGKIIIVCDCLGNAYYYNYSSGWNLTPTTHTYLINTNGNSITTIQNICSSMNSDGTIYSFTMNQYINVFKNSQTPSVVVCSYNVEYMTMDSSGNIFIGANDRIYYYNITSLVLSELTNITPVLLLANFNISSIACNSLGTVLAVGSQSDSNNKGRVITFQYSNSLWSELDSLNLYGENNEDKFGSSLCLDGNGYYLAVGAPCYSDNSVEKGKVYIFRYTTEWIKVDSYMGSSENEDYGSNVIIGDTLLNMTVSSINYNSGDGKTSQIQLNQYYPYLNGSNQVINIQFPLSVSVPGSLLITLPLNIPNSNLDSNGNILVKIEDSLASDKNNAIQLMGNIHSYDQITLSKNLTPSGLTFSTYISFQITPPNLDGSTLVYLISNDTSSATLLTTNSSSDAYYKYLLNSVESSTYTSGANLIIYTKHFSSIVTINTSGACFSRETLNLIGFEENFYVMRFGRNNKKMLRCNYKGKKLEISNDHVIIFKGESNTFENIVEKYKKDFTNVEIIGENEIKVIYNFVGKNNIALIDSDLFIRGAEIYFRK